MILTVITWVWAWAFTSAAFHLHFGGFLKRHKLFPHVEICFLSYIENANKKRTIISEKKNGQVEYLIGRVSLPYV